uniref:Peptidase_M41 domain-containing protein n=1 Tax=Strongyloides papillosus TaxID=174720 RepID=A0A0N5BSE3_STREA
MNESYARVKTILTENAVEHRRLAEALLEYGTLTAKEVQSVIEGRPLEKKLMERASRAETIRKTQSSKKLHPGSTAAEGTENFV